jgi:AraC family transcriptional regulator, transcriptional activator of pobA
MNTIVHFDSVEQYNRLRGVPTNHPLVSVVDLTKARPMPAQTYQFGLYAIYLKELKCGDLRYGRSKYDYQEGTLLFIAPGQIIGVQPGAVTYEPKGWALLFHPELIRGTALGRLIKEYSFFSYDVNEALHLSVSEREIVVDCFRKIEKETTANIDKHSKKLIASNIELLLNYSTRFYDRQFITRDQANMGMLAKFEQLIHEYYSSDKPRKLGVPTVSYCATALHLSANYFGDLIRKESGITAQEYIQTAIINIARDKMVDVDKSISEVAYDVGFKYPQHFTRLFKQKVGVTPAAYRSLHLN